MTTQITNSSKTEQLIINRLMQNIGFIDNIGLMNGKIGIAIFFFHLARRTGNKTYEDYAGQLIDRIYQRIGSDIMPPDFGNGLAGIAWAIEYLVDLGFLEGDTDEILTNLDDKIFLYLTTDTNFTINLKNGLLGFGFYLLSRLRNKDKEAFPGRSFLLKRLMIDIINRLYQTIEEKEEILLEPVTFDITWHLPLLLILLSETRKLNIYNQKVDIVLNRLSSATLSTFPIRHSNRLFLRVSMKAVLKQVHLKGWHEHISLLKYNISTDQILQEFSNKDITVGTGLAGVGLIVKLFNHQANASGITQFLSKITDKILQSIYWEFLERKEELHAKDLGILSGLAGVGCFLLDVWQSKPG